MNRRIRILPLLVAAALPAGFARGDWLYDAPTQRMTELDPPGGGTPWILNCTGSGTDLAVASVQQTGAGAVVDLRLPVRSAGGDAFSVVGLGIDAFRGNLSLEEIRLPDTLVSIGRGAFDGCTALRRVSPFLPDSVASIGVEAFRNVPAGGTLRLGFGGSLAFPPDDRGWNGSEHFKNTAVEEVAIGPGVEAIPWNAFLECRALTNLDLRAATSLSAIGVCSFLNCTALRRVDPLLPDTVASIGAQAFAHDPIEGTLRLGFGGPVDLRDDERGWNVENYFEDTRIGEVQFGPGVVNVKRGFITGNPALSNVVFRTTALTAIGQAAFEGCTALRRVEPLLPDTVVYLGSTAFNNTQVEGSLRIGFGGPVRFGTEFYGQSRLFWGSRISEVVAGPGVTNIPCYFACDCGGLTNVVFQGTNLVDVGASAFAGCSALTNIVARPLLSWTGDSFSWTGQDLSGRLLFPKTSRDWDARITELGDAFTPWADASPSAQADYVRLFPDGPTPRGHAAIGGPKRWLVPFSVAVAGEISLSIVGEPFDVGVASPAYADQLAAQPPVAFSVSRYGERGSVAYESGGYRGDEMGDDFWEPGEPVLGVRAFSFDRDARDEYRVAWLWREAGYALTANVPESGICAVSVSGQRLSDPEIAGDYFVSNAVATIEAVPRAGARFVRWFGDVPEDQAASPTATIAMDRARTVAPYVEAAWTYRSDTQTVTDGYWVLGVAGSPGALEIASVQVRPSGIGLLDLRKPTDGCVFASIGTDAFRGQTELEEIRLPDTLASIGRGAFDGCTALRRVSPFLPDSVASIGVEAFRNVPAGGTLRLGFGGSLAFPPDDRGWNGSEHFKNTAVEEVAIGPGVEAIPWNAFLECRALTNLDLRAATSLSAIGVCSFLNCTALRRVDPLLPDTVASIGAQAFAHDPIEGTLRLGFGGPVDLRDDERGWNVENYFEDTRIGEVQFGPGVVNVKRGFITGNPALSNVVFRTTALTAIGQAAFEGCTALRRVEPLLPDTVVYLGSTAFNNTQVEGSLRIGFGGPVRFGTEFYGQSRLFWGSRISEVVAGPGVTNIPCYFACDCRRLTNVVLRGKNLVDIGESAFSDCSALEEITFRTFPLFAPYVFARLPSTARFFVPDDVPAWQEWLDDPANATPWDDLPAAARDEYFARWDVHPSRPKWRAVGWYAPFPENSWVLRYIASAPTVLIVK